MTIYALVYVTFDYHRFEEFIGIYESKDEAISAAVKSDFTDDIRIFDDSEIKEQPASEHDAELLGLERSYFWLVTKRVGYGK